MWGKRCFDAAKIHNGTLTGMLSRDTDSLEKKLKQPKLTFQLRMFRINKNGLKWIEMDQMI